jgi:lipoprotein-anchoring transpeptidase ErfK/SrfK
MRVAVLALAFVALAGCGGDSGAPTSSDVPRAKKVVAEKNAVAKKQDAIAKEVVPRQKHAVAKRVVPTVAVRPRCADGDVRPVGSATKSYAAVVVRRATAYRAPGAGPISSFGRENVNGVPTVFAVLAERLDERCRAEWYRVQLPLRPNGATGWVAARDVAVAAVTTRIEVDLSARRVTLFDRGRRVLSAKAAIGSSQTPTPIGRYYVNQRLVPADPSGPFGPGAIGISAFSDVLTGWTQGGPIAIHGTNRPELIGGAISNGCVRIHNAQLRRLFGRVRAGTPVVVRS